MVDVNVHPQKTTVKFADHDLILEILQAAVRETLAKTGAVPMMDFSAEQRFDIPVLEHSPRTVYSEPRTATKSSYNPFDSEYIDPTAPMPDTPFTGFDVPYDGFMPRESARSITPVARDNEPYAYPTSGVAESVVEYIDEDGVDAEDQTFDFIESAGLSVERREFGEVMYVGGGYAAAIYGGSLVLVSLRRAKERLLYEDIVRSLGAGAVPVQRMFFAEELILSLEEYERLENYATEFAALGFEIEYRGECAISVSGRPAVIDMTTPIDELLYELLHSLDMGETLGDRERCRMAELMAQRGSHNYGGGLNSQSAKELLDRLAECDNPSFTPSGCPIMAELTLDEIKTKLTK